MPLIFLRAAFLMVAMALAVQLSVSDTFRGSVEALPWLIFGCVILVAGAVVTCDVIYKNKRLLPFSAMFFGLLTGLFLTYILRLAFSTVLPGEDTFLGAWFTLALGSVICYTCITLLIQTKDDFRLIIPYVEFAKEIKGLKPFILDTSVVIDGRIADLVETQVLDNQLVMPQFVIAELQGIADSSDKLRRNRGRRGLDILNRLRSDPKVDLMIYDRELPEFAGQAVDQKLVLLAKHMEGKVVTNDYNLNKVARIHEVGVINLNDISNSLKPVFLPGEHFNVRVIKAGEEHSQGVGYLDDGTMVVIDGGRNHIGELVITNVTTVLQTSAGRMVFGKFEGVAQDKASKDKTPQDMA